MKKIISIILILAMMLCNASCFGLFSSTESEMSAEEPIPYHENYVFNSMKPIDSYQYEAYPYKNRQSKPLIMGGNYYHGGFIIGYSSGPYVPGYATFDVTALQGKKLSFLIGSTQLAHNNAELYSIFQVVADDKVVVDTVAWPSKAPERYTVDLTGVSKLTFKTLEGYNSVAVSEITAWDGDPVATGPAISADVKSLQLVKELYPFSFRHTLKFYTDRVVTEQEKRALDGYETDYFEYINNEDISVAGKKVKEAIAVTTTAALIGERSDHIVFNTEKQFEYLNFTVGGADVENSKSGSSWVVIYADGVKVFEEKVISNVLPTEYTVNIKNCANLKFDIIYEDGGQHTVVIYDAFVGKTKEDAENHSTSNDSQDSGDICKLISTIKPYAVASYVQDPLFEGITQYKTFSMAGRKYNEGIVLLSNNSFLGGLTGAHACFNLDGKYKYLTFTAGILDKTPVVKDDTLKIYLDGVLSRTIELHSLDLPKEFTVELKNCKELKIELAGVETMVRPAYGVANMVVYKDVVKDNDLFPDPEYNYPDTMPLVSNIKPYLYNYGPGEMGEYEYVYDGSKQHSFKVGDKTYHEGFLLMTSVHLDLTGAAGQAAMMMAAVSSIVMGGIMLLAADVAYESSFAAFDLHGEFKTVTFTVACQEPMEIWDTPQTQTLKIGSNDEIYAEIEVGSRMTPKTYTINIKNTEQLVFWLDCDPETDGIGTSSRYAIYDITVGK